MVAVVDMEVTEVLEVLVEEAAEVMEVTEEEQEEVMVVMEVMKAEEDMEKEPMVQNGVEVIMEHQVAVGVIMLRAIKEVRKDGVVVAEERELTDKIMPIEGLFLQVELEFV